MRNSLYTYIYEITESLEQDRRNSPCVRSMQPFPEPAELLKLSFTSCLDLIATIQLLVDLQNMFRFASCALVLCLVLPGHAARLQDSATDDCQATKFAGYFDQPQYGATKIDDYAYGSCGYEDKANGRCSSFYVEDQREPGKFYQCRSLNLRTQNGRLIQRCVVWDQDDKSLEACSSSKPEIQSLLNLREECHAILCGYARSGKWNGKTETSHFVGAWKPWPQRAMEEGTWGWESTIQKKCDPQVAKFSKGSPSWGEGLIYWQDYVMNFNKTTCGCMSEDKC